MARCCTRCFQDSSIVSNISREGAIGRCSYCGSIQVHCIDPSSLSDKLELFTYGLIPDLGGFSFSEILSFYGIFSSGVKNQNQLIDEIFGVGASEKYFSFDFDVKNYEAQWEGFKLEIKHRNRFFPKSVIHLSLFNKNNIDASVDVLFQLFEQLEFTVSEIEVFYRARVSELELNADQMSCPPPERVTGGRANPVGIPYLYVADNLETCISEVRPSNSSYVYVSEFSPVHELKILDLTDPRKFCSASSFSENQLSEVLGFISLLELFSKELSKPVIPEKGNLEYIPTQFLSEFIKSEAKLDGISFKSSFGLGMNYVFFDGGKLSPKAPEKYVINSTRHEYDLG